MKITIKDVRTGEPITYERWHIGIHAVLEFADFSQRIEHKDALGWVNALCGKVPLRLKLSDGQSLFINAVDDNICIKTRYTGIQQMETELTYISKEDAEIIASDIDDMLNDPQCIEWQERIALAYRRFPQ